VVTSASTDGKSESVQSDVVASDLQNLIDSGAYNTVDFGAETGIDRYHVYRLSGGLYGFMGAVTTGTSFQDDGSITPDTGKTPPIEQYPFASDYPGAVSYFEQRRMFAGTPLNPQKLWGTRSGTESDLAYSIPSRDDDAISFRIAARDVNTIRHIVPMDLVILLTSGGVWRLTSSDGGAITPSTLSVKPQSGVGANTAQPIIDDTTALYIAARGGHIRELGYNWQVQSFVSGDLSLRAPNLFDGYDITELAFQRAPTPIMWGVSTAGILIGMTYVPDQDVRALWTRSTTNGVIESVCCVAEGIEDRIYVIVKRTIGGATVRYVERMAERLWSDRNAAVFVDCAGSYNGDPTTTVTGLTWLRADCQHPGRWSGDPSAGSGGRHHYVAGRGIHCAGRSALGRPDADPSCSVDYRSWGGAGPREKHQPCLLPREGYWRPQGGLIPAAWLRQGTHDGKPRSPPNLITDEIEIVTYPSWSNGGQFVIYHDDPLPMTVLSMTVRLPWAAKASA
jgi:hypothetical protein